MYNFTPQCIFSAYKKLNGFDDKIGGLICILSVLEANIVSNKVYRVNLRKLKLTLQEIFDISKETLNINEENWFIVFSKNWRNIFFSKIIKNKIDILSLAIFFLRRTSFENKINQNELINLFIQRFNLQSVSDLWFDNNDSVKLEYNQFDNEKNQKDFYALNNFNSTSGALKFNGSIVVASATELTRCAQVQTLYAGMDMNSILLLNKIELNRSYDFESNDKISDLIAKTCDFAKNHFQLIYYGVPGCGKSHKVDKIINAAINDKNDREHQVIRVVFHPDYTNADFVGQIMPLVDDGIEYRFKAGPFARILKHAYKEHSKKFFLVIEELNRGNAAAIFGDLFQLLDREKDGFSTYSINNPDISSFIMSENDYHNDKILPDSKDVGGEKWILDTPIRLPPNLSILATMNTSDQNVFMLDNAFQRRWKMEYIPNNIKYDDMEDSQKNQYDLKIGETNIKWGVFRDKINERISDSKISFSNAEDKQLGLFFVKADSETDKAEEIPETDKLEKIPESDFANKVLKYLWNDIFKRNPEEIFLAEIKTFGDLLLNFKGADAFKNCFNSDFVTALNQSNSPLLESPEQLAKSE